MMRSVEIESILLKGDRMSYSDIQRLLELDVKKKKICRALGIGEENEDLYEVMDFSTADKFYETYTFVLDEIEKREEERNPKKKWEKIAVQNGIEIPTFRARVSKGMDYETAATKPVKKGIPKHIRELARKNGIRYNTVYHRIKEKGMDPIEAATKKTPRQLKNGA